MPNPESSVASTTPVATPSLWELFRTLISVVMSGSVEFLFEKQALVDKISAVVVTEEAIAGVVAEAKQR